MTNGQNFKKSYDAPIHYHIMQHFGTEMCTFLFQNDALWDIGQVHYGICERGPMQNLTVKYQPIIW